MKATNEHLGEIRKGLSAINAAGRADRYKAAGISHERYRWDCFFDAWRRGHIRDLYRAGLNDAHIDTVLRRALGSDYPAPADTNELISLSREHWDGGDKWGSAMATYFDCCAELTRRSVDIDPSHGYRPGVFGPEPREDYSDQGLIEWDSISDEEIVRAAEILRRYTVILDRAGHSY